MSNDREVYRRVYTRLWRHPAFKPLTADEKVLALYLVTGPQTNLIGWYRFSPALAAEDIGASLAQVRKRLAVVLAAFDWQFEDDTQLLWIRSWLKWNPPNGIHQRKAWQNAISVMPNGKTRDAIMKLAFGVPENPILREQRAEEEQELDPVA
jgi:hypothetical protein